MYDICGSLPFPAEVQLNEEGVIERFENYGTRIEHVHNVLLSYNPRGLFELLDRGYGDLKKWFDRYTGLVTSVVAIWGMFNLLVQLWVASQSQVSLHIAKENLALQKSSR